MNLVALIGNVASEPKLHYTLTGKPICEFKLAVSRPGGEPADFFHVKTTDKQAEIANEYLRLGRRVGIEGRLHTGVEHIEIVAHRVQLLGKHAPVESTI